jgi:hypothetical protein
MKNGRLLETHLWSDGDSPHQIIQDGRTIVHHRCLLCGRDFGFELDGSGWHAIYVGLLRVECLADEVTARWLLEDCPKQMLASDELDRVARFPSRSDINSDTTGPLTTAEICEDPGTIELMTSGSECGRCGSDERVVAMVRFPDRVPAVQTKRVGSH